MTKEEIIQYILNSPENTNSNVLRGMLDELDNGGDHSSDPWKSELVYDFDFTNNWKYLSDGTHNYAHTFESIEEFLLNTDD